MSEVYSTLPKNARVIPLHPDYAISTTGRVFSCRDGVRGNPHRKLSFWRLLRQIKTDGGYPVMSIVNENGQRHQATIHSLLLTTFVGPRPRGMVARHLNGKREDCRLGNLAWGTPKENQDDRIRHGTMIYGDRQPLAVLNVLKVEAILALRSVGWGTRKLGKLFETDRRTIMFACDGETWNHLCSLKREKYIKSRTKARFKSISPAMLKTINRRISNGESIPSIAKKLGVTKEAIYWRKRRGKGIQTQ